MKFRLVLLVVSVTAFTGTTLGNAEPSSDRYCAAFSDPPKLAWKTARRAYDLSDWRQGRDPRSQSNKRRLSRIRSCAEGGAERNRTRERIQIARRLYTQHRKEKEAQRAARRALLPYRGGGHRWAIPWYIVACESGGSWGAANPSGAAGPYQLMPEHGRPFPVNSRAQKMEHHQIASRLWNGGSGASNWVCA